MSAYPSSLKCILEKGGRKHFKKETTGGTQERSVTGSAENPKVAQGKEPSAKTWNKRDHLKRTRSTPRVARDGSPAVRGGWEKSRCGKAEAGRTIQCEGVTTWT